MKQIKSLLTVSLLASISYAKPIVVAVIDTGIDSKLMQHQSLCKTGHKDFTNTGLNDMHGHGTHISGIIDQYSKNYIFNYKESPNNIDKIKADYCQIIIKYYDPKSKADSAKTLVESFKWAIKQKVDIINISGGGYGFSAEERKVIIQALDLKIRIVAAAGNDKKDIDKDNFYPAMYDKRIYIVGNLVATTNRTIAQTSNYGKSINTWEVGTNVFSRLPNKTFGYLTGTSQAAAVKTGKIVREMLLNKQFQLGTKVKYNKPWSNNETKAFKRN
jgi:subtilisin family serine protease